MKTDRYVSSVSNLFVNNRLLKFVVIVLAGMQLMNYVSAREARENERTVIIPAGLTERVEVSGNTADDTYLTAMAAYIAQLIYSTTPATTESQTRALLNLFSPELYKDRGNELLLAAASRNKNQVTLTSKILSVKSITEPEPRLEVSLTLDKHIFGEKAEETTNVKLLIDYEIRHGKFTITGLGEG